MITLINEYIQKFRSIFNGGNTVPPDQKVKIKRFVTKGVKKKLTPEIIQEIKEFRYFPDGRVRHNWKATADYFNSKYSWQMAKTTYRRYAKELII